MTEHPITQRRIACGNFAQNTRSRSLAFRSIRTSSASVGIGKRISPNLWLRNSETVRSHARSNSIGSKCGRRFRRPVVSRTYFTFWYIHTHIHTYLYIHLSAMAYFVHSLDRYEHELIHTSVSWSIRATYYKRFVLILDVRHYFSFLTVYTC